MVSRGCEGNISRSERLLSLLGNIDEDILAEAIEIDNGEKLSVKRNKRRRLSVMRYSAVAACLVIALCVLPALKLLKGAKNNDSNVWNESDSVYGLMLPNIDGEVSITSGDEWNYFAARRALTEKYNLVGRSLAASSNGGDNCKFAFLGGKTGASFLPEDDTLCYDLKELVDSFNIVRVTYFTVEFTEKLGYLGSRFYGKRVEVVITEMSNFESMITFRCGDEFFSCLENGLDEFSTHKYIDGFNVVKSLGDEDIFSYHIDRDKDGHICGMHSQRWESIYYLADKIALVGTAVSVETSVSYSISELEEFFNQ